MTNLFESLFNMIQYLSLMWFALLYVPTENLFIDKMRLLTLGVPTKNHRPGPCSQRAGEKNDI